MSFVETILEPVAFLLDPTKRIFYIYILSSLTLAVGTLLLQGHSFPKTFKSLVDVRIWQHRSTQIDFALLFINTILKTILFVFVVLSAIGVSKMTVRGMTALLPNHEPVEVSQNVLLVLYAVVSFVALDFSRFYQHYLFHKIPVLWRFHKIHHSAEVMTPVTLYRTHPVESLVSALRRIVVTGVIAGIFIFETRAVITGLAIFGVNAFDFLFNFFGSNLRHSHVWLSFGPLNSIFMSPAQHQIHHSRAPRHHDKNLGFALSLWDQLFGTYYPIKEKEFLVFGVRGERYKNVWQALKAPFTKFH